MSIWDPYSFDVLGRPVAAAAPPALRVIGGEASPGQRAAAQAAFAQFSTDASRSFVPNPTRSGVLSDGSTYKISRVGAQTVMQLWPIATLREEWRGAVHVFTQVMGGFDGKAYKILIELDGSYTIEVFPPFADGHPALNSGVYAINGKDYLYPSVPYIPNSIGMFGRPGYFFRQFGETVRGKKILATSKQVLAGVFPRYYDGAGYTAFATDDPRWGEALYQDNGSFDGDVIHAVADPSKFRIASYSIHPTLPKAIVLHYPFVRPGKTVRGGIAERQWYGAPPEPGTVAATYRQEFTIASLPAEPSKQIEIAMGVDGVWAVQSSEPVHLNNTVATGPVKCRYIDSYLSTVEEVSGVVSYPVDDSVTVTIIGDDRYGAGRVRLEAAYDTVREDLGRKYFDRRGDVKESRIGGSRRMNFAGHFDFAESRHFSPYSVAVTYTTAGKDWYDYDGRRLHTLDAAVSFSANSDAAESFGFLGAYKGEFTMHVKCQRRLIVIHNPDLKYICYLEEDPFQYTWVAKASCEAMAGNGENARPHSEDFPLEGEGEMVPTGEPTLFLVIELDGKIVHREKIEHGSVHASSVEMIPCTSIYLQPAVEPFTPEYIPVDEYKRRLRTLVCTGYQWWVAVTKEWYTDGADYREMNFRTGKLGQDNAQLDDYFLSLGQFQSLVGLTYRFVTDPRTGYDVLMLEGGARAPYPKTFFLITPDRVTKIQPPDGDWGGASYMTAS